MICFHGSVWGANSPDETFRRRPRTCRRRVARSTTATDNYVDSDRQTLWDRIRYWEEITRPDGSERADVLLKERFDNLPEQLKGDNQMLGRVSPGCEGTQGVFPKCTFACQPCYHSADANKVRVDGMHTLIEVSRQMRLLNEQRGPHGHCQLIGGEVSLLPPEDHAASLSAMRSYGRVPMSFSHGDFPYEYLKELAVDSNGKRRFDRLDFAVHFDRFMVGRSGIIRPNSEEELNPFRKELIEKFRRLQKEHGVNFYVAHNMTVQPGNVNELASVLKENLATGFRMFSFQPAAFQGDERRWTDDYTKVASQDGELVWKEIEKGVGCRLPYQVLQMGDPRCNRMCLGFVVAKRSERPRFVPLLDDHDEKDLEIRDEFLKNYGSFVMPAGLLVLKFARHIMRRPKYLLLVSSWALRYLKRAGGSSVFFQGFSFLSIVMHRFMDAEDVRRAWDLMELGVDSVDPKIKETQDRLKACSYSMARPEENRVVPACVQHAIYDPEQNKRLRELLPLQNDLQLQSEGTRDLSTSANANSMPGA